MVGDSFNQSKNGRFGGCLLTASTQQHHKIQIEDYSAVDKLQEDTLITSYLEKNVFEVEELLVTGRGLSTP